jgi:hypothetical protein
LSRVINARLKSNRHQAISAEIPRANGFCHLGSEYGEDLVSSQDSQQHTNASPSYLTDHLLRCGKWVRKADYRRVCRQHNTPKADEHRSCLLVSASSEDLCLWNYYRILRSQGGKIAPRPPSQIVEYCIKQKY